jgi:hypothetical protein
LTIAIAAPIRSVYFRATDPPPDPDLSLGRGAYFFGTDSSAPPFFISAFFDVPFFAVAAFPAPELLGWACLAASPPLGAG